MRALLLVALFLTLPLIAEAQTGPTVRQSTCTVTWPAPQTNADGTNLADLKEYRVYAASTAAGLTPTLAPVAIVPAAFADPPAGALFVWPCKTLATGQWFVTATAVDTSGNEGVRSPIGPFVLIPDPDVVAPSAPGVPVAAGP